MVGRTIFRSSAKPEEGGFHAEGIHDKKKCCVRKEDTNFTHRCPAEYGSVQGYEGIINYPAQYAADSVNRCLGGQAFELAHLNAIKRP